MEELKPAEVIEETGTKPLSIINYCALELFSHDEQKPYLQPMLSGQPPPQTIKKAYLKDGRACSSYSGCAIAMPSILVLYFLPFFSRPDLSFANATMLNARP